MLRNQEQIVTCLLKMGLVKSSLILEETAIVRSIRSSVNKVINCDSANISKSIDAAASQLALIDRIDSEGLWDRLTPVQVELASIRRANPSASLSELGQLLTKPVSKSTVEYRWRKLESVIKDGEAC
jgi:DNA-binding protein WhiA